MDCCTRPNLSNRLNGYYRKQDKAVPRRSVMVLRAHHAGCSTCRAFKTGTALFNTEGTEAVNTNHNNGSPFDDARKAEQDSAGNPGSDQVEAVEAAGASSSDPLTEVKPSQQSVQAMSPGKPAIEPSATGSNYAKYSVEGVSSIQKLVHAMENTGEGFVDEVIDMEPRERNSMEFRVTCPGSPVRRLRLTGNRYTFGNADGCSIRLTDETLRPMHAVLLRDVSRIIVRAYSVPIQVNGTRTTEATLTVGDVLRLGHYQFELLSAKPVGMNMSPRSNDSGGGIGLGDAAKQSGDERAFTGMPGSRHENRAGRFSDTGSEGAATEDLLWRDRLRREVDQWRERQLECDRREGRIDERESELRNRETELWSRAENLHRRESRLQSQESANFQLYDEFSQRQQELITLREENRLKEESFHAREMVLRDQELQYRSQLEEATRRLHESQRQADAAAESVAEMREQFDSLNNQIELLSKQHLEIESREVSQRAEHEELRKNLEQARDQAVENHAASETRRQVAEEQAAALEQQIVQLKAAQGSSESEQLQRLSESEAEAEALRQQVEELQRLVSEARQEAETLRADYEEACSSVKQLETLVSESQDQGVESREKWIAETGELRAAVEKLSSDMEQASHELNQLRDANEDLNRRLTEVQQERDQVRLEMDARPDQEEFDSLREQLQSANERMANMQFEHEQTLVRLEAAEQKNRYQTDPEDENESYPDTVLEQLADDQADDGPGEPGIPEGQHDVEDRSIVDEESPETAVTDPHSEVEEHGYNSPAGHDAESLHADLEKEMRVGGELPDGDQIVDGSLASKLIQDFESEDVFAASRSEAIESSLEAFSNLAYSGEENESLSFTGFMRPDSQDNLADDQTFNEPTEEDSRSEIESNELRDETVAGGLDDSGRHASDYEDDPIDAADDEYATEQAVDETVSHEYQSTDSDPDERVEVANESAEEEEDTIEAYMNRLLKHVRGDDDQEVDDVTDSQAVDSGQTDAPDDEMLEPLDPNAPLVPRSLAPERDSDLDAMRELANTSARIAIKRSARLQSRNTQLKGLIRLSYALGAISCGAVCYLYLTGMVVYVAVMMTVIVAVIYVREAMQFFQEASYQYNAATNALHDENSSVEDDSEYTDE